MAFNAIRQATKFSSRLLTNSSHYTRHNLRISSIVGQPVLNKKEVEVTFIKANGDNIKAKGKVGDSLLDTVINNNLDLDGFGACEGTLTCSTCHVIFPKETYDSLPNKPSEEELDMLDLAYELSDTSRLGCQINLTEEMDGLRVNLPSTINDARN